jgi:hypothetical protein
MVDGDTTHLFLQKHFLHWLEAMSLMKDVEWEEMKEKVVVLRELHRAIIYTTELSKQAMEGHVNTAFIAY